MYQRYVDTGGRSKLRTASLFLWLNPRRPTSGRYESEVYVDICVDMAPTGTHLGCPTYWFEWWARQDSNLLRGSMKESGATPTGKEEWLAKATTSAIGGVIEESTTTMIYLIDKLFASVSNRLVGGKSHSFDGPGLNLGSLVVDGQVPRHNVYVLRGARAEHLALLGHGDGEINPFEVVRVSGYSRRSKILFFWSARDATPELLQVIAENISPRTRLRGWRNIA